MTTGSAALLRLCNVSKRYGSVAANDDVSLTVNPGEIHALLGENGAGKSTLMKILTGLVKPDHGEIIYEGQQVEMTSPLVAQRLGIAMVHQHFALFEGLSVLENIALGMAGETADEAFKQRVIETAKAYKLDINTNALVFSLSAGEKQRIEIVRALMADPKLLVLDEPTSVLTPNEADDLFVSLKAMKAEGRGIIFISHKLNEVRALCDQATILRGGKVVATCIPAEKTAKEIAELMIGQRMTGVTKPATKVGATVLHAKGLSSLEGIQIDDLDLKSGEILGVAGVAGNGQEGLFALLSGETVPMRGSIKINDTDATSLAPNDRRNLSAAFVPEERLGHGAVVTMSLTENVLLSSLNDTKLQKRGIISWGSLRDKAQAIISAFDVRSQGLGSAAGSLSGGNLQKFVMGRELLKSPKLFVVNQPTWGVDMGAAQHIRTAMIELAKQGAAILVISQDLDELLEMSDKLAVLHDGHLGEPKPTADWTIEALGLAMTGSGDSEAAA